MHRPRPVTLERPGGVARLEPLAPAHTEALYRVSRDERLWAFYPFTPPATLDDMHAWSRRALESAASGAELPFAIVHLGTGELIGSTRYLDIQPDHDAIEIGATWVAAPWQRSGVNTDCKYLLLRHAFEVLGAGRVQFKGDALNEKSRRALERIGATFEGVLRRSRRIHTGRVRDTFYYSIIAEEWPGVKARFELALLRPGTA